MGSDSPTLVASAGLHNSGSISLGLSPVLSPQKKGRGRKAAKAEFKAHDVHCSLLSVCSQGGLALPHVPSIVDSPSLTVRLSAMWHDDCALFYKGRESCP